MGMGLPLRLQYTLTAEDFSGAAALLFSPGPVMKRLRPVLLRLIWLLLAAAGGLIAYTAVLMWHMRLPLPPRPVWTLVALSSVWTLMLAAAVGLSRDPEMAQKWLRGLMTRRMLARVTPGPRSVVLSELGFDLDGSGARHVRSWGALRRARRNEDYLVLAARDIWVIIPLARLTDEQRAEVIKETGERVRVDVDGVESGIAA